MEPTRAREGSPRHLPGITRADRRRALLVAVPVLLAVGALDLALGAGSARILGVWAGWALLYLVLAAALRSASPAWEQVLGLIASLAAVVAIGTLARLSGGLASPYLLVLVAVPFVTVVMDPDARLMGLVVALAAVLVGGGALLGSGRGWVPALQFAVATLVMFLFGLLHVMRLRRQGSALLRLAAEHAGALSRLADVESARERSERLAAVGVIADGVAHEANGPIAVIRTNVAFALEELRGGRAAEAVAALQDAGAAAERIRQLIGSLQHLSPTWRAEQREVDLVEASREAARLAAAHRPPTEVALAPAFTRHPVRAHGPWLVDLVLQLVLAVGPGLVRLAIDGGDGHVRATASGAGGARGDPGLGLGLALAQEYVRRLGGRLELDGLPRSVTVELPAA
jgi:signal transduction histidine kinase